MSRIPQLSTSHIQSPSRASPYSDRPTSPHHSVGGMASNLSAANMSDSRKKQNKRDEAIRKKIEGELSRKRTISTNVPRSRKTGKSTAAKGTVAALRPSPALTVPENMTVSDASQLCAAKRTDCVLVVDDEEGLSGIFTAKDLAFRRRGARSTYDTGQSIMTRGPMVTRDTTSATEALQLMVQRGFRHLPVCNDEGNVVGLLDITKVFHEALEKLERGSSASAKLHAALEGVQSELGNGLNPQAMAMMSYVASLREKTTLPDLTTVMDSRTQPATIAGIFTSKDVVLRVIAAGLDPNRCSVVRVMTPHPDVAEPSMTVHDALKKMYVGRYLNLPVVEGMAARCHCRCAQTHVCNSGTDRGIGPMWGRFFDSFQQGDDNESAVSGSNMPHDTSSSYIDPGRLGVNGGRSPHSEVHPNDSASVIEELHHQHSSILEAMPAYEPIDDGTYVFKFRTPSGRTHRFQARQDNFENLRDIIAGKLESDPFFEIPEGAPESAPHPEPHDFTMSYTDSDGDTVELTSDSDVADAVRHARQAKEDRVIVYIHGGKAWDLAGQQDAEKKAKEAAKAAQEETRLLEKGGATPVHELSTPISSHAHAHPHNFPHEEEKLFGVVPRDMVLPASVGFLGVVIIVVFAMSRSSNRY
ncbi:CBS and PB1 domain protein [Rhizoctonia solani]|uniref:CBS and PB1 domain protein n=1 Tax=Rhizoctonia solani TaxID=456999 RepID=A0A8H8T4L7_9AGAM|nr:CBS and PB1 domain protein [Rhizoctonia solani]QRW27553.1 CBS and PB1 domain protein [Rhizoctonia solani]